MTSSPFKSHIMNPSNSNRSNPMKPNQDKTCRPAVARARLQLVIALALWLGALPGLLAQAVPDRMNYQGILLQGDGTPVPAQPTDVEFRIWSSADAGTLLWGRTHRISPDTNGAFNVVLMEGGSPITAGNPMYTSLREVFTNAGSDTLYLELTVKDSTPIRPRQRLVSAPYAFLAHNVTHARNDFTVVGTATATKFEGYGTIPIGGIIMWSGASVPTGWALCDGTQGTPDLRGRFVLSSGTGSGLTPRSIGQTGGKESHVLSTAEMPSHNHATWLGNNGLPDGSGDRHSTVAYLMDPNINYGATPTRAWYNTSSSGNGSAHTNMPPFYVLAFIMRVQ